LIHDGTNRSQLEHARRECAPNGIKNIEIKKFSGLSDSIANDFHCDDGLLLARVEIKPTAGADVIAA
jgi:hypothetical protein